MAADIVGGGPKEFGITGEAILDTDNEDAINAARHRAQALHPGRLWNRPTAYGHEPSGVAENGNRMGKGVLRVCVCC